MSKSRWTKRRDGIPRITVRIEHHITKHQLVYSIAEILAAYDDLSTFSRRAIIERSLEEASDDEYVRQEVEAKMEQAEAEFNRLFPGYPSGSEGSTT